MIKTADLNFKTNSPEIELPSYETEGASGMDVRAYGYAFPSNLKAVFELDEGFPVILPSQERILIKTGLFPEVPEGYELQIRPRSGLALKYGITVLNSPATIDSDYRGEIGVILINTSNKPFPIYEGDRIAQLVLAEYVQANVKKVDSLSKTKRGTGGFNSTGIQ